MARSSTAERQWRSGWRGRQRRSGNGAAQRCRAAAHLSQVAGFLQEPHVVLQVQQVVGRQPHLRACARGNSEQWRQQQLSTSQRSIVIAHPSPHTSGSAAPPMRGASPAAAARDSLSACSPVRPCEQRTAMSTACRKCLRTMLAAAAQVSQGAACCCPSWPRAHARTGDVGLGNVHAGRLHGVIVRHHQHDLAAARK